MSNSFWGGHIVIDPADFEAMFSNDDGMGASDLEFIEAIREDRANEFSRVRDSLPFLPPREADYLELYFFNRMRQSAIAELFGVSQPTVCYRLRRAATRIRYILTMPEYDPEHIEEDLKSVISDTIDVQILLRLLTTTCQSTVARELGATQGYVRHRFLRSVKALANMRGMENYVALFEHVAKHLNIMRHVQRDHENEPLVYVLH